jgi:hypothetical protein
MLPVRESATLEPMVMKTRSLLATAISAHSEKAEANRFSGLGRPGSLHRDLTPSGYFLFHQPSSLIGKTMDS